MAGKDDFVAVHLKFEIVKDAEPGQHDQFMPDCFSRLVSPSFFCAVLTAPCAKGINSSAPASVSVRGRIAFFIFILFSHPI